MSIKVESTGAVKQHIDTHESVRHIPNARNRNDMLCEAKFLELIRSMKSLFETVTTTFSVPPPASSSESDAKIAEDVRREFLAEALGPEIPPLQAMRQLLKEPDACRVLDVREHALSTEKARFEK